MSQETINTMTEKANITADLQIFGQIIKEHFDRLYANNLAFIFYDKNIIDQN